MLFKLMNLTVGSFAIISANDEEKGTFPVNVHGFIQVINNGNGKFLPIMRADMVSAELAQSNEVDELKKQAVEKTINDIADAYSD